MGDNSYNSIATFDRYDEEFQLLAQQIEKSLMENPPSAYSANLFQQANDLVKQMSVEARSLPSTSAIDKRTLLDKVRMFKTQLQSLQAEADRNGLLASTTITSAGGAGRSTTTSTSDQQQQLLDEQQRRQRQQRGDNMLIGQNDTLERARRTMEETETIALEITEELGHNREKLMSAHDRIREVSGLTGRAKRLLSTMAQRSIRHKMILYAVGAGLGLGFFILLWSLWS